jgi:hypothetical protein
MHVYKQFPKIRLTVLSVNPGEINGFLIFTLDFNARVAEHHFPKSI